MVGFLYSSKKSSPVLSPNHQIPMTTGYQAYDATTIPQTGDIVIFFHASRCPSCQEAEKNFLASGIPTGLTILKADFDTETKLKLKYGILSQTSFAYIKADGTLIKRWIGARTIDDILAKITEAKNTITTLIATGEENKPEQKSPDLTKLTPEQEHILFEGGTEPPFNNAYWDKKDAGIYVDVIDGTPLFSSTDKFDSGTGWPSFTKPIDESIVDEKKDTSLWMERTEIKSSTSSGHLGHVFNDGPVDKGGQRYCINSAALRFVPLADMEKEGYEKYLKLFRK
ncbi:MAG: Peptide methionine sulfoxide reductase MsrB [Candidatus Parcubacteria bacterium]